ncbi:phage tail protein [Variovorax sp. dw_308]|uniref:phage tail protein n=1 Tax=Variovorax sp. dw_308 TaxID=2721546 RepID=UPI001C497978|nr:phage tail protein [Variovorax sp. dw_308]
MDANGLRFFLLANAGHWRSHDHTRYDSGCRALRLASEREVVSPIDAAAEAVALAALDVVPRAVDSFGSVARWDGEAMAVVVHTGHLPGDAITLPLDVAPTDICVGTDGVLYAALPDAVLMHDLRGRFATTRVPTEGFVPWRLAAHADGGVLLMERTSGRLARLEGRPLSLQTPARDEYAPQVFRPELENCFPPTLRRLTQISWPADEQPIALAAYPGPALRLLSWGPDGAARLRSIDATSGTLTPAVPLAGGRYAYSLAWLANGAIAVRLPGRTDALSFDDGGIVLGEVFPLATGAVEASFAHTLEMPPRYPLNDDEAEPLLPLSLVNTARQGEATNWADTADGLAAQWLDSGQPDTVWHRLMAEASIPAGTGFIVWLAATADPAPPPLDDAGAWQPHGFGRDIAALAPDTMAGPVPRAAWDRAPSELPGHPGLASWTAERDRRGLFGVLIQDATRRVRRLVGRYLWVRCTLLGDGRATPEILALRAWAGRFDYVDHYLPRFLRETQFGADAQAAGERLATLPASAIASLDAGGAAAAAVVQALQQQLPDISGALAATPIEPQQRWRLFDSSRQATWHLVRDPLGARDIGVYRPKATPSDFLSRMVANYEGVLTTLEDRVASAHVLTHPATVPEPQLDWLGAWVGVAFDAALPANRRRAWLREAPRLARWHGTRRGLSFALDVASGGGVSGGEIVVIEDFRLRRLLATLLGVDLVDEDDPLLPGLGHSGNSIVGDTLFLADQQQAELMALFRDDQATDAENDAVRAFYGRLAHRATVFVHQEVEPQDLGLIRRIVELEAPAHVDVRVVTASKPLLVGVSSLVAVDTYLAPPAAPQPVRVQRSVLGMGDLVRQSPALDPRVGGSTAPILNQEP